MHTAFALRVYGPPVGIDEDHDTEQQAIESGRAHLRTRLRPAFAEVKHRLSGKMTWTAYIDHRGALAERYDREPGSD